MLVAFEGAPILVERVVIVVTVVVGVGEASDAHLAVSDTIIVVLDVNDTHVFRRPPVGGLRGGRLHLVE
jgi:hypothetical protein